MDESAGSRAEILRQRLVEIAARRVPANAVEPVVREAIREEGDALSLRSALAALRSAVVAWYASGETPDLESWDPTTAPLPAEALSPKSLGRACHDALGDLEEESPVVTRYLRQLGSGLPVDEVAKRAKISREILFQRIFRGREQLDRRLVARGVRT